MNAFLFLLEATATAVNTVATSDVAAPVKAVAEKQPNPYSSIFLLLAMFGVFYFLLIRPNQKKEKQRRQEIASIKEGDKIITSGGIKGKVVSVKEDTIVIESKDSKIEIVRFAVGRIIK